MTQNDFSGGMNMVGEPTRIGKNQYYLLVNGRIRFNAIRPVKLPTQVTAGLPASGTVQGIYGFDKYLLVFVAGYAYYRNMATDTQFSNVENFSMQGGTTIYAEAVPASTSNYARKLSNANDNRGVNLSTAVSGTPVCVVCQDGINQPWKIYPDGTAQVTQTFAQWTLETSQEYVPVGTQMLYDPNLNKLYVLAKDNNNRYTQILQSVSGRPLDFVIAVDTNGNKLPTGGDAWALAHSVGFNEVTSIQRLNSQAGAIFVGTLSSSYLVTPNLNNVIYNEPTFNNDALFPTGPTDKQSLADINGDIAFIDQIGIRSFNSVKQQANEGNSIPFSATVAGLFEDVYQTTTAAINFDNYALYAINSVYGACVLVYDLNTKVFVGIDIYPGVAQIKQFATVKVAGNSYLYFATTDNKIYQAFAGSTATCKLYAGEWCSEEGYVCQKINKLGITFSRVLESGTITTTVYTDSVVGVTRTQSIAASSASYTTPRAVPFPSATTPEVAPRVFDFKDSVTGYKVGFLISWNCDASLNTITVESIPQTSQVPLNQMTGATYTPTV